jgi:hypothetical protein
MMIRALFTASALLLWGCASGSTSGAANRDRNLITTEEIAALPVTNAWDLIDRLRPNWLRNQGPASIRSSAPTYALVYVDEVRSGGLEMLYRISSQIIREVRFINGRDATTKWGMNHGSGVILITTGR